MNGFTVDQRFGHPVFCDGTHALPSATWSGEVVKKARLRPQQIQVKPLVLLPKKRGQRLWLILGVHVNH